MLELVGEFYLETSPMATISTTPDTVQITKLLQSDSSIWMHFLPTESQGGSGMGGTDPNQSIGRFGLK